MDPSYHTKNYNDENFQGSNILELLHNPLPCHPQFIPTSFQA